MKKTVKKRWYDKYLPFVARSPEMKVKWLVGVLKRSQPKITNVSGARLSLEEIRPYITLLLEEDGDWGRNTGEQQFFLPQRGEEGLAELFSGLDEEVLELMLMAADIYDVAKLFGLILRPTVQQAVLALRKSPPPHEKKPYLVRDRVFHGIHAYSPELLEQAVTQVRLKQMVPEHFDEAYERFVEIIKDEQLLTSLYPKAKVVKKI